MTKTRWKVRVGVEAEKDFVRILKYTADTFGERQSSINVCVQRIPHN